MKSTLAFLVSMLLIVGAFAAVQGADMKGDVRFGYIYLDETGNEGVYQPAYNLYEGAALSLENFSYQFKEGTRVFGNLHNVTMNNRNMTAGVMKSRLYGLTLHNDQYRRQYSFDGDKFTRRRQSSGQAWVQPTKWFRAYGGYGWTDKHGTSEDLYDQFGLVRTNQFDYRNKYYNGGVLLSYDRSRLKAEYRGSKFTDNLDATNGRKSDRFRVSAVTPVPRYEQVVLRGGFETYRWIATDHMDSLKANTLWGSAQWYFYKNYSFRYSILFDRARRSTYDVAATDNITNAFYLDRVWPGWGAVTVGYRYNLNDDIYNALSANGYYIDGWVTPTDKWKFRAGLGIETEDISDGAVLTGARDYSRYHASARYKLPDGYVRFQWAGKKIDHDDISTRTEYNRIGGDADYSLKKYGEIQISYDYLTGEYTNTDGIFRFNEHIVSGDIFPIEYRHVQVGAGGVYMRSKDDLDVESFQVRFSAAYRFMEDHKVEVRYTAHNFDDLAAPNNPYTQYYTGNVVEVYVVKEL